MPSATSTTHAAAKTNPQQRTETPPRRGTQSRSRLLAESKQAPFEGKQALFEAPHLSLFPGLAIVFTVLTLNLLGDSLSNLNDPRRRKN